MKKLVVFLFLLCIVTVGVIKNQSSHRAKASSLLLYNIEALAAGESILPVRCLGRGSIDCPASHDKVDYVAGGYSLEEWR